MKGGQAMTTSVVSDLKLFFAEHGYEVILDSLANIILSTICNERNEKTFKILKFSAESLGINGNSLVGGIYAKAKIKGAYPFDEEEILRIIRDACSKKKLDDGETVTLALNKIGDFDYLLSLELKGNTFVIYGFLSNRAWAKETIFLFKDTPSNPAL